ncbi:MAG: hypothetical protein ACI8PZ_006575, partial [Myxococcota bacterium]
MLVVGGVDVLGRVIVETPDGQQAFWMTAEACRTSQHDEISGPRGEEGARVLRSAVQGLLSRPSVDLTVDWGDGRRSVTGADGRRSGQRQRAKPDCGRACAVHPRRRVRA